jgi:alcohol dehydrogenase
MVMKGGGRGPAKLGVIPLSDGAGEVAAVGAQVTRVKVGDWIIGTFHPRWFGGSISADYLTDRLGANLNGMLADSAVVSEEALVPMPRGPIGISKAAPISEKLSSRTADLGNSCAHERRNMDRVDR